MRKLTFSAMALVILSLITACAGRASEVRPAAIVPTPESSGATPVGTPNEAAEPAINTEAAVQATTRGPGNQPSEATESAQTSLFTDESPTPKVHSETPESAGTAVAASGTATPSPTPVPAPSESEEFWNRAGVGQDGKPFPGCGDSIFNHALVDPEDATPFFLVENVYPHSHMVYWSTRQLNDEFPAHLAGVPASEQVQLFAPADIYSMQVWRTVRESHDGGTYEDWAINTEICGGYRLTFGHVGTPIDEILVMVGKAVPRDWSDCPVSKTEDALVTTRVGSCVWRVFFNPPISAGAPISRSSGYSTGFDFGLELRGLTAEELRQHPSYGYSINPWAYSGGTSVCTLEYFPEPYRTSYLEMMEGRCGPLIKTYRALLWECGCPYHRLPMGASRTVGRGVYGDY